MHGGFLEPGRVAAGFALLPWMKMADVAAAVVAPDLGAVPAAALGLFQAPWLALRTFVQGAENDEVTFDVRMYPAGGGRGILAAQLIGVAGATELLTPPLGGATLAAGAGWRECVHHKWQAGAFHQQQRTRSGAEQLIYLPTAEHALVVVSVTDLGAATRVLVAGRPALEVPPTWPAAWVAATGAGTINNPGGRAFTWLGDQRRIRIENRTGGEMYVKFDAATAGTTAWSALVLGYEAREFDEPVYRLAIYDAAGGTQGTDYVVLGAE
jgi:hypothetical protein